MFTKAKQVSPIQMPEYDTQEKIYAAILSDAESFLKSFAIIIVEGKHLYPNKKCRINLNNFKSYPTGANVEVIKDDSGLFYWLPMGATDDEPHNVLQTHTHDSVTLSAPFSGCTLWCSLTKTSFRHILPKYMDQALKDQSLELQNLDGTGYRQELNDDDAYVMSYIIRKNGQTRVFVQYAIYTMGAPKVNIDYEDYPFRVEELFPTQIATSSSSTSLPPSPRRNTKNKCCVLM